jgi:hypothetical protein
MSTKKFSPNANIIDSDSTLFYGFITSRILRQSKVNVTGSPTALPATALANRMSFILFNNSADIIYIGNSSVGVADGFPVYPHAGFSITIEDGVTVYAISAGTSSDVRIIEGA